MMKDEKPTPPELRKFAYVVGAAFLVVCTLLPWLIKGRVHYWPLGLCALLWTWGTVHPESLSGVHRIWMTFGAILGAINSRIILGALFFIIFSPIALVLRLLKRSPISRHLDSKATTFRILKSPLTRESMERPF
jgi:Saxitoxin biosynthesis operon protein SxtJ